LVAESVTADDDGLLPARDKTGDGGDDMLLILAVPGESVVGSLRIGTGD